MSYRSLLLDLEGEVYSPGVSRSRPCTYELIEDCLALRTLDLEWRALYERSTGHYLSETSAWAKASWETTAKPRGRRLRCLVARQDGRLVLIWPFVTFRKRGISVMQPLGPEASEYGAVLVEDGREQQERIESAWRALRRLTRCDVIHVPRVRSDSPLDRVLQGDEDVSVLASNPVFHLRWNDYASWDDYFTTLSARHRGALRRKRRRLAELGELSFEFVTDPNECEPIIDWMLTQKRRWMDQSRRRNDWLFSPHYRAFLSATLSGFGAAGRRGVFVLRVQDRVAAAEFSGVDRVRVEWSMGAFDCELGKYSPGEILKEHCVRWAFERGLSYDMRHGDSQTKQFWNPDPAAATSYACAITRRGRAHLLLARVGRTVASRISLDIPRRSRALTQRLTNPRGG